MPLFKTSSADVLGSGINIGALYGTFMPMLQAKNLRFRALIQQLQQQGDMSSQDLLAVQRETGEMAGATQLTSDLMKVLRDMVSSVLKNVA